MNFPNPFHRKRVPSREEKARIFWDWFVQNHLQFLFITEVDDREKERLLDEFIQHLHFFNENIYFEMGGHPDENKVELVITASGNVEHFEDVEFLVSRAPELKDWEIIAFKPPLGADFTTEYGGYEFDPKKIIFIPLDNEEDPTAVGFVVCYPEFNEEDKNIFFNGTYLMLDVILGEKSVATDIDYIDVVATPEDIGEYPFMHLDSIQQYIETRKGRN